MFCRILIGLVCLTPAFASAAEPIVPITVHSYSELGKYTSQDRTVLLKVGAEWCGPCNQSKPAAEQFAASGKMPVVYVDIDSVPEVKQWLPITGVPHYAVVRKNSILFNKTGAIMSPSALDLFVQTGR